MSEQLNLFEELSYFEGADVEYKGAKGGLPRDLWETYSAFANTQGGTLLLGVTQDKGRLEIHGVPNAEKVVQDFWNTVNNRGKVSANLLTGADVTLVPLPGNPPVVRIRVPRADRRQRPVFIGSDPFRGTFRRNNEGDFRCSEAEVRRMFSDQAEESADSRILEGFSVDDLHPDSIRQYRNRFASRGQHAWLAEDDLGLLTKLGGWRRDRISGREGLTAAGLLMFGREQAIRDPAGIPGFQLDYRERYSDDPAVRWTDRLTLDGTWEGNVFQFYQQVLLKLSTGPGIRRPFRIDAEGYRTGESTVSEALQEALVNALIHADYTGQGGIVIDRWVDRLEFSNPGTLLVSREQLLRGAVSECRNKSLQLMFQMLGAGDKAGSGIDKIRAGWASEHWQSPILAETLRPDRVILTLPLVSMLPETTLADLRERFGAVFDALDPEEVQILVTAAIEGEISNQRMQDILSLHRVDITRILQGLVRRHFLVADGVGRGTRYALEGEQLGASRGDSPPHKVSSPPRKAPSSPHNGAGPPYKQAYPPEIHDDIVLAMLDEPAIAALVAPVRNSERSDEQTVRRIILGLCEGRNLTLRQLAELLNRGMDGLRDRHISKMVKAGLLELKYPDRPSHRNQGYRAAQPAPGDAR